MIKLFSRTARLILVELKEWNGTIECKGDHWVLNGNDMGRSPVKVTDKKRKILAGKLRDRLPNVPTPWVDYRVVLCGSANAARVQADERDFVRTLEEFLRIGDPKACEREFPKGARRDVNNYVSQFDGFFRAVFRGKDFSYQNYRQDGEAIFTHRDGLYKEYRAIKRDDRRYQALLRRWDLSILGSRANTREERAAVVLREHRALGLIHQQNGDLDQVVLQPLSSATSDDVLADFCELYRLPAKQIRLKDFLNRYGGDLSKDEKLSIVKVLISHFAALHDIGVAHRDIGDHSVWLERPAKVSLSGFITAYYPEAATVGSVRELVRAGSGKLPEDSEDFGALTSDPFRRDVYLLGAAAYNVLYGQKPVGDTGYYEWKPVEADLLEGRLTDWFQKALGLDPNHRFVNARKMLDALNEAAASRASDESVDMGLFEPYRTDALPMVDYPIKEELKRGPAHIYKSELGGQPCVVRVWYGLQPDPERPEANFQLLGLLERAWRLKAQGVEPVPSVIEFGISPAGTFVVHEWADGVEFEKLLRQPPNVEVALQIARAVVRAVEYMHTQDVQHGDLHPRNVIVLANQATLQVKLIDAVDYKRAGRKPYNPAYVPVHYESAPLDQRDRFAAAKMVCELLSKTKEASGESDQLLDVIAEADQVCTGPNACLSLERLQDALDQAIEAKLDVRGAVFTVVVPRIGAPSDLLSDNGTYYVQIQRNRFNESENILTVRKHKQIT